MKKPWAMGISKRVLGWGWMVYAPRAGTGHSACRSWCYQCSMMLNHQSNLSMCDAFLIRLLPPPNQSLAVNSNIKVSKIFSWITAPTGLFAGCLCFFWDFQPMGSFLVDKSTIQFVDTFIFEFTARLWWTERFVLSNLSNWQKTTWQYWKVGNRSVRGRSFWVVIRLGRVFLKRTRLLSGIQFTAHFVYFFVVETKRLVCSTLNVILTR